MYNVVGTRLIVSTAEGEEGDLLDSSRDDIIDYSYDGLTEQMTLRVLDPEGLFIQRLIGSAINSFNRRALVKKIDLARSGVEDGGLVSIFELDQTNDITARPVVIEMIRGAETSGRKNALVTLVKKLEDDSNNHIVEIVLGRRAGPQTNEGDTYKSGSPDGVGTKIGTAYREDTPLPVGSPYAISAPFYNINITDMVNGVETLFEALIREQFQNVKCMVIVDKEIEDKLKEYVLNQDDPTTILQKIGFAVKGTETGGGYSDLRLVLHTTARDEDSDGGVEGDPRYEGLEPEVVTVCRRLNTMLQKLNLGGFTYVADMYNNVADAEALGFENALNTIVYMIYPEHIKDAFFQRDLDKIAGSSGGIKRLRTACERLRSTDDTIASIRDGSPMGLIGGNKVMVFRAGVENPNVLSIVFQQDVGKGDLGVLQGTFNLVKKKLFESVPGTPGSAGTTLVDDPEAARAEFAKFWESFYRTQVTSFTSFENIKSGLEAQGHEFTEDQELALQTDIEAAAEYAEKNIPGAVRDPKSLAAYMHFLREKQRRGGDTITVRVEFSPELSDKLKHGVTVGYLQYVSSPVSSKYSFPNTANFSDIPALGGFYRILRHRHAVTSSDAYTEVDMVRLGVVENNTPPKAVKKDRRDPTKKPNTKPTPEPRWVVDPSVYGVGGRWNM